MRSPRRYSSLPAALALFLCGLVATWLMSGHCPPRWARQLSAAINTAPQTSLREQVAGLLKAQPWNRPAIARARRSAVHASLPVSEIKDDVRVPAIALPKNPATIFRSRAIVYESGDAVANPSFRPEPALRPPKRC